MATPPQNTVVVIRRFTDAVVPHGRDGYRQVVAGERCIAPCSAQCGGPRNPLAQGISTSGVPRARSTAQADYRSQPNRC